MSQFCFPLVACVAVVWLTSFEPTIAADSFEVDYATAYDSVGNSDVTSWEPYKSGYAYDALSAGSAPRLVGNTSERLGKVGVRLIPFAVLLLLSWWANRRSKKPASKFTD